MSFAWLRPIGEWALRAVIEKLVREQLEQHGLVSPSAAPTPKQ